MIAAILEVIETRLTPFSLQAYNTFFVPSTAGLISVKGSRGSLISQGEATWMTWVEPEKARLNESRSSKSASTSSTLENLSLNAFLNGSIFF